MRKRIFLLNNHNLNAVIFVLKSNCDMKIYIKKKGPNIYSVHTRDPNWEMDSFLKLTFQIFKVVIDFNSEISTMHMCLVNFRHISFKHYSWMQWLITLFYYSKYYCLTMVENRITIYHFFKCHFILSLLSSCRKGLKKNILMIRQANIENDMSKFN